MKQGSVERFRRERRARAAATGKPLVDGLPEAFAGQLTLDGECWRWHGQHRLDGRPQYRTDYVYRILFRALRGALSDDAVLHHAVCHHRWCANPWHTEPMTQGEHMRAHGFGGDVNVGQALKTHCPKGHPYDEGNTYRWRGERQCRTCMRETYARHRRRNGA